jgi:hypothetical protein
MHELLILMGGPDYTHGRPYNPQTQGLVENGNKDLKNKLVSDAISRGGVTHVEGNEYDWVQDVWETVDTMNDLPIEMYGGIVTPFMALNDGVPRNMPHSRKLSAHDIEEMHVINDVQGPNFECTETRPDPKTRPTSHRNASAGTGDCDRT